jgi:hypothetical protein
MTGGPDSAKTRDERFEFGLDFLPGGHRGESAPGHITRQGSFTQVKEHSFRTLAHTRYRRAARPAR